LITLRTLDALTPKKETPQERERRFAIYPLDAVACYAIGKPAAAAFTQATKKV
jgi:hypothetical protein